MTEVLEPLLLNETRALLDQQQVPLSQQVLPSIVYSLVLAIPLLTLWDYRFYLLIQVFEHWAPYLPLFFAIFNRFNFSMTLLNFFDNNSM